MSLIRFHARSVVTVTDHAGLRAAWKLYGGPMTLVARFVLEGSLTPSQLRRLPADLRDRLEVRGKVTV